MEVNVMKVYKEYVGLDDCDFKLKCFINSSLRVKNDSFTLHPHWHDEIELLYVLSGSALQQVNDNIFSISEGDVVVIRSQDIHITYTVQPGNTEILVILLNPSLLDNKSEVINTILDKFNACTSIPYPINAGDKQNIEIVELIKQIYYEHNGVNAAKELFIMSYCASLIGLCTSSYFSDTNASGQHPVNLKKALERIFSFIDDNYNRPISLNEAAEVANFSIPHFCRLFRQTVGMSFIDYLNHYRINKSIQYLKKGTAITEIAQLTGFNSINSYIRTFKKYMTLSPSKYKNSM